MSIVIRIISALLSGFLLTLAFFKSNTAIFAWVALIPLFAASRNSNFAESFKLGFITGLSHFLSSLYWLIYTMDYYGGIPIYQSIGILFLLCAYLSLYPAFFAGFTSLFSDKKIFSILFVPALWVSLEYIRGSIFVLGFSWCTVGYSQVKFLSLIQIIDMLGVYGISFIIISANYFLFLTYRYFKDKKKVSKRIILYSGGSAGFFFISAILYGVFSIDGTENKILDAEKIDVAVIQGNIDQQIKWNEEFFEATTEKYINLSKRFEKDKVELIVWPEAALPYYLNYDSKFTQKIKEFVIDMQTDFLIGAPFASYTDDSLFNSAYLIGKDGSIAGRYDKSRLVPFGEYVPMGKWFPFIKKMTGGGKDFQPGSIGKVIEWNGSELGVQICFEIIFPKISRMSVKNNANFIAAITNDTWFGDTTAPFQHFAIAVFRAVENKRAIVRCANTGISGAIYPDGRIIDTTPLFTEAVKTYNIPLLSEKTFYTKYGDIFAGLCVFISLFGIIYGIFLDWRSKSLRGSRHL